MKPPPDAIDGAKVLVWSLIDARHRKTNVVRLYADGAEQLAFAGVALAQYEEESSAVYAFYCDRDWNTQNDSCYSTFQEAKRSTECLFIGLADTWQKNET
jgi:hypothetical protein